MSIPRQTTISCPHCGTQYQAMIFESLNTDFAPNVAETIISGERFDAKCPSCGFVAHLEYDFLYHDMKHHAMVWVVHPNNEDYENRLAEIEATMAKFTQMFPSLTVSPYKFMRIVADMGELREKVACLETGRDDRVIELCKISLEVQFVRHYPDFHLARVFYTYDYDDKKHIVCFCDETGAERICHLRDDTYFDTLKLLKSLPLQADQAPYQIIDRQWAIDLWGTVLNGSSE